ncbi:MAG: prepilin-type cleavage/methylation domain-containing protein [Thermus sp.]
MKRGFTLVELLVVISVFGILVGLVASTVGGLRRQLTLEDAANTFSQDLQTCRTNALSWGDNRRVRFLNAGTYVVERKASPTGYTVILTRTLPSSLAFSNVPSGAWIEFDPRTLMAISPGFPTVGSGVSAPEVRLTNGNRTLRLVLSMTGAVKTAFL